MVFFTNHRILCHFIPGCLLSATPLPPHPTPPRPERQGAYLLSCKQVSQSKTENEGRFYSQATRAPIPRASRASSAPQLKCKQKVFPTCAGSQKTDKASSRGVLPSLPPPLPGLFFPDLRTTQVSLRTQHPTCSSLPPTLPAPPPCLSASVPPQQLR